MLNHVIHDPEGGAPEGVPPLLIAHGLFGSARNWGVVARRLSDARRVVAVDLRNHGDSFHDPVHTYAAMAADLDRVIASLGGRVDLLGHSMGGKAAMMLALTRPEGIGRLIVADIAPVRYAHSQLGLVQAMAGLDLGAVRRRSDADAQLAASVSEPALRAFLLQSLAVGPDGVQWRINLAALADQMPHIMGFPDIAEPCPLAAVFLRGGASDYVAAKHQPAVTGLFPNARIETLEGVGHWMHAEDPRGFEARVRGLLS